MKTTIDLPSELVREVKLHALNEGRELKDTAADLLRLGLDADTRTAARPKPVKLPLVECAHGADVTPEQVAAILSAQETLWHHQAS